MPSSWFARRKIQSTLWEAALRSSPYISVASRSVSSLFFNTLNGLNKFHGLNSLHGLTWLRGLVAHTAKLAVSYYNDVVMSAMASKITSLTIVYSTVYSGVSQRNHQSSASLAFVWGIHRWPVNSPHKGPVTRKMFSFDDVYGAFVHKRWDVTTTHCWWT